MKFCADKKIGPFVSGQLRTSPAFATGHLCLHTHPVRYLPCRLSLLLDARMFDHIDQPPQVPLYPAKRPLHPRPQWMYSLGHSQGSGPSYASPHILPPSSIPPSRTFKAQEEERYSLSSTNDVGERGVLMSTPFRPYDRVDLPECGRVEVRRSIHPYDHNGASGCRGSEVGSTGINEAVGTRAELQSHNSTPRPHPSERNVHPARYPQHQPDTGHGGGTRVRNIWEQQAPGEWNTGRGSSAAAAAAPPAPGGTTWGCGEGPAWGGGGGSAWN